MSNKYKAVFFDRDNTLTCANPEKRAWYTATLEGWSGKPYEMTYERMMGLFTQVGGEGEWYSWYRNIEEEKEFYKAYYRLLLQDEGVQENLESRAQLLFEEMWCNNDRMLYPEVMEVLEYFKEKEYRMGVISDTSPSLQYTLQQLGIAKYFTSFTASSLVGAEKPSPIIFNAALNAQGVTAKESLYVDDYDVEANGAREQGFTAFLIDRSGKRKDEWIIQSLKEMVEFVEREA